MFKILIVDDSNIIIDFLTKTLSALHPDWIIDSSFSYTDALKKATNDIYDLFILDYELNPENISENGFNLGITLKNIKEYHNTPMIFETSYPNHVLEAVNNLNCIYYLVKPYYEADVQVMLDTIISKYNVEKKFLIQDSFGISTYINEADIVSIKSDGHNTLITTISDNHECINYSLSNIIKDSSILIQCHRSYAVNIQYINNVDKTTNLISLSSSSDSSIPIGRKYKEDFLKKAGIK